MKKILKSLKFAKKVELFLPNKKYKADHSSVLKELLKRKLFFVVGNCGDIECPLHTRVRLVVCTRRISEEIENTHLLYLLVHNFSSNGHRLFLNLK